MIKKHSASSLKNLDGDENGSNDLRSNISINNNHLAVNTHYNNFKKNNI